MIENHKHYSSSFYFYSIFNLISIYFLSCLYSWSSLFRFNDSVDENHLIYGGDVGFFAPFSGKDRPLDQSEKLFTGIIKNLQEGRCSFACVTGNVFACCCWRPWLRSGIFPWGGFPTGCWLSSGCWAFFGTRTPPIFSGGSRPFWFFLRWFASACWEPGTESFLVFWGVI